MMRLLLAIICSILCILNMQPGIAQRPASLFQPLTWEQASLQAARGNKLVMVEVGTPDRAAEKKLLADAELLNYLQRNVVAIRIDPTSPGGEAFLPHLLMFEPPLFAFFMPYGDVLEAVKPELVARNPSLLREAFEKAREMATVKKSNSRSIRFAEAPMQQALTEAEQEDRLVYVWLFGEKNQPSLLMERNVFNLDRVADFYNQHFINLRVNATQEKEFCQKYGVQEIPAFLFLNARGKLVFQAHGYSNAGQLIQHGEAALEKAKGIPFRELSQEQAGQLAREQNKMIFTDYYTPGSAHKEMARSLFTDPELTDFFKEHFISVSNETDQSALVFTDAAGHEQHRILRVESAEELLQEARKVLAGEGLAGMQLLYEQGKREAQFMENYVHMLARAGKKTEASEVLMIYFGSKSPEILKEAHYWELFNLYGLNASPAFFDYVLSHRSELYTLHGENEVRQKIAALWIAGAENFVHDGQFDEDGFKSYIKRLKKEKVKDWRIIARNAHMHAAEKVGDWRTFIRLAEEKWNEEKISDAELYSWGVKINERCSDDGVRYKTAQWLAQKAMEIERKEQLTGKVKMSSYKGFFSKLVDDLLKK